MQFGFTIGKGTTDAIFIVGKMWEKHLGKSMMVVSQSNQANSVSFSQ